MSDSVSSKCPNTEKRVENTVRLAAEYFDEIRDVWIADETLMYLLNRNKNYRVNGEIKSLKSILIKTGISKPPLRL